ncbi:hypothetical protein [Parvibium lacunae]|uniref:Uncharacterized protein n=1 Tax=Parvibium lacunae TaxID=1888893 RepID=A0A368L755_9BURK|nr:hypothetical protein [Parvibium lacunae]RCS59392.1 hypothetical protein DU000_01260 [Parvibium lacunae]
MSPYQVLTVAVRLFSLWLFVFATSNMVGTIAMVKNNSASLSPLFIFTGIAITVLVCLAIWFFPQSIAHKLLPKSAAETNESKTFDSWFSMGCSLIGLWALSKAIPSLVHFFTLNYLGYVLYADAFSMHATWKLELAFNIFYLLFGFWLLLGARGIKKLVTWAKYA